MKKATFAGGCFWCMQGPFDIRDGVVKTMVGFSGGNLISPSYEQVCKGDTGHYEVIQIEFDDEIVSYKELLKIFFLNINPTDPDGQFADKGYHYRTAIFYHDDKQMQIATEYIEYLEKRKIYEKQIVTKILKFETFYPAEKYHQKYYKKNSVQYNSYKLFSGRKAYVDKMKQKNLEF